ncbi:MAG: hypothetical protein AB2A00_36515 [Myxococcota bacterium]
MRMVVVRTHRVLTPFQDPVGKAQVGLRTLEEHQRWLAAHSGLTWHEAASFDDVESPEPALVLADHTFLTRRLLHSWLKLAQARDDVTQVALPRSRFVELYGQHQDLGTTPDGGATYDAWFFPKGVSRGGFRAAREGAQPVFPQFKEIVFRFPVPRNILARADFPHPITTTVALHIKHWVHVLWVNNLWPQIELVERVTSRPLSTVMRLLMSLRPGVNATKWAVARNFSYVARNVDIHPTACVELSVLGEGCRVGPYALVRGSVLGKGVHVEERANVCYSVLNDGDFVSKNSTVVSCVGYPDADLCINGMQYCVAGRNAALTSLVRPMDMKYRDDVTVRIDGRTVAIKELMIGSCFGHGTFVGPDILIAPGREIPNNSVIAPPPGAVLTKVSPEAAKGGVTYVDAGTLKPLPSGKE